MCFFKSIEYFRGQILLFILQFLLNNRFFQIILLNIEIWQNFKILIFLLKN